MAIEQAADLAAMFSTDDFAVAATYTPAGGGGSSAVTVILDRPSEASPIGALDALVEAITLQVRRSEVAELSRGDEFVVGADTLAASTDGELDLTRSVWTVGVRA